MIPQQPCHLQQRPISLHILPQLNIPPSRRLSLLPRPRRSLLLRLLVPTTAPNLQTLNLEPILPIVPGRLARVESAAAAGVVRKDAVLEAFVEHKGDGAEGGMGGEAGDGFGARWGAAEANAGFGEGGVVGVDEACMEDLVDWLELEEQSGAVAHGSFVRLFPGYVEVDAEDDSTGFVVPGCAVGESLWRQRVCECAFSASFRYGGEARACYKENAGGSPVEDFLLERTHAEAGIATRVEES